MYLQVVIAISSKNINKKEDLNTCKQIKVLSANLVPDFKIAHQKVFVSRYCYLKKEEKE